MEVESFGKRLNRMRIAQGVTQLEAVTNMETWPITRQQWSHAEMGLWVPWLCMRQEFARAINVPADTFDVV